MSELEATNCTQAQRKQTQNINKAKQKGTKNLSRQRSEKKLLEKRRKPRSLE